MKLRVTIAVLSVAVLMFASLPAFAAAGAVNTPVSIDRAASVYSVLYPFAGGADGRLSRAGLVSDPAGNLYGTTLAGGAYGQGTVFKMELLPGGTWKESVLHSFQFNDVDGFQPEAGLVLDASGNLYGTTRLGGDHREGAVFQLSPNPDGVWSERVLHSFDGVKGGRPTSGLVFDNAGNLYGTTFGSPYYCGTVFRLAPKPDGTWTHAVLHNFGRIKNAPNGGCQPSGSLIFDSAGRLYGTTSTGGANIYFGTVFRLKQRPDGTWKKTVLHSFSSSDGDGAYPYSSLVLDRAGNLYGTTFAGGRDVCLAGCGTVFKLVRASQWKEKILYSFTGGLDGAYPYAGLIMDGSGNLFGTTNFGGESCSAGCGVVFKLARNDQGKWTESVPHRFNGNDGAFPNSNLILDASGNLFGTTQGGGNLNSEDCPVGCGIVFELTP